MKFSRIIDLYKYKKANTDQGYIVNAYNKIISVLEPFQSEVITKNNLDALPLTEHTKTMIWNFSKSPELPTVQQSSLQQISGIGDKKAQKLNEIGIKNVQQLKHNKDVYNNLSDEIKNSIEYEVITKIPNASIKSIEKAIANESKQEFVICGSYRRQLPFSSDLDVILIGRSSKDLDIFIDTIKSLYATHINNKGDSKANLLIKPYKTKKYYYRMDIFLTPKSKSTAMILYATGSKENNISMRAKAKKMGMMLNQEGLHDNKGNLINIKTEQGYYNALGMKYLEPHQR